MWPTRKGIIALALCIASLSASAGEALTAYTEEWRPFNFMNESNEVDGFTTAIVRKIAGDLDTRTDIQLVPWSRALDSTQRNKNSLIYSIYRVPERESLFKWVGPIYQVDTVLWGIQDRDLPIKNVEDAKKFRITVQANSAYAIALENLGFNKDKLILDYAQTDIKMVLRQQADLVPLSIFSIGKLNAQALEFSQSPRGKSGPAVQWKAYALLSTANLYLAFNKETPDEVIAAWQSELNKLKKTALFRSLEKTHISPLLNEARGIR
jgi:polar amino acid transport system substrate-binding protein